MNSLTVKKVTLLAITGAVFAGYELACSSFFNVYSMFPILLLACLLFFVNRKTKKLLLPLLFVCVILSGIYYYTAAGKQSSLLPYADRIATVTGVVSDEPVETAYGYKVILKNVYVIHEDKLIKCNERLFVYLNKEEKLQFGDQVRLQTKLEKIAVQKNFGDFDYERYYQSKGMFMKGVPEQLVKLSERKGGFISTLLYSSRQKVKQILFASMPNQEAALLYGILTGSKSDIDEDVMNVFSKTGLAHILSVSGLHIGFLVLLLTYLLKPLRLKDCYNSMITLVVVMFYIMLIGAPVPALRALLMFMVMLGGKALGQKYDLAASASFAALLLLLYNPLLIHDPGFIISFACIYSIAFLHQRVHKWLSFLPTYIGSSLALSVAVWIGITPILIIYFNYVSMINILINVIAVPIAFLITIAGFAAVVLGLLVPILSEFVFATSYYLIKLLYLISEKSLLLPFAGFTVPSQSWAVYGIYYSGVLMAVEDFWISKAYGFKKKYVAICAASVLLLLFLKTIPTGELRIYFVDVGQGDCSVITTPNNKTIVIDGGGQASWKNDYNIGDKVTVPALLHLGVSSIDTAIISHMHDDHIGGVLSMINGFKVGRVLLPESDSYGKGEFASANFDELLRLCKQKNIPIVYLKSGSSITAGNGLVLRVLAPTKPYIRFTDSDVNNNSLVLKLEYKSFEALFTGDIQSEGEQRLLQQDLRCDVLKVAHHGSPYSSTQEFIKKAAPKVSVVCVGKNNYGHPAKEVLESLKIENSKIYRTDMDGAIMLSTKGKQLNIKTVR